MSNAVQEVVSWFENFGFVQEKVENGWSGRTLKKTFDTYDHTIEVWKMKDNIRIDARRIALWNPDVTFDFMLVTLPPQALPNFYNMYQEQLQEVAYIEYPWEHRVMTWLRNNRFMITATDYEGDNNQTISVRGKRKHDDEWSGWDSVTVTKSEGKIRVYFSVGHLQYGPEPARMMVEFEESQWQDWGIIQSDKLVKQEC